MDSNTGSTGRLTSVDLAKGVVLFAIVILHALYCQPGGSTESVSSNPFIDFAYAGLFLFFIFSGYFFRPGRTPAENIVRRVKQLFIVSSICLLVLPLINLAYFLILGMDVGFDDYLDSLWLLVGGDNVFGPLHTSMSHMPLLGTFPGYYYVQVMMVAFLIFYPLAEKVIENARNLVITTVVLLAVTVILVEFVGLKLPFYAQLAPIAAAFMFLGAYMKKFDILDFIQNGFRSKNYWLILAGVLVVMLALLFLIPPGHSFDSTVFGKYGGYSVIPFYVTMVACCYVQLVFFALLSRVPGLCQLFSRIGTHTLALLLFHAFFIKVFTVPFYHLDNTAWFPAMPVGSAVIAGIAAIAVITVLAELYPHIVERIRSRS